MGARARWAIGMVLAACAAVAADETLPGDALPKGCSRDADCMIINADCCGCSQGGKARAVLKSDKRAREEAEVPCRATANPCFIGRPVDPSCAATAVCENKRCALRGPPAAIEESDDYAIYSQALRVGLPAFYKHGARTVWVARHTVGPMCPRANLHGDMPRLPAAVLSDLQARAHRPRTLRDAFDTIYKVILIDERPARPPADWTGFAQLSDIGYDAAHQDALLYLLVDGETGSLIHFQKRSGFWIRTERVSCR